MIKCFDLIQIFWDFWGFWHAFCFEYRETFLRVAFLICCGWPVSSSWPRAFLVAMRLVVVI